MALREYHHKRDFKATPEPRGKNEQKNKFRFVIQKHAARRLHYDFRIELDGVMKSWAVTRGPSLIAGEKRLAVRVEAFDLPGGLLGDATRVRQALINYANNAIKFTEQGVISLRGKVLEAAPDSVLVRLEVEDTGIGMNEEEVSRLFQEFMRIKNEKTRNITGSGLGLSIVKKLVEDTYHGTITVKSKPDVGTTFEVHLPLN